MKVKAFNINEILWENDKLTGDNLEKIKDELKPYVVYFKENDFIGICFGEQKENIKNILRKYGKTDFQCQFINVDTFFKYDGYDWDFINFGDFDVDGNLVWNEFGKLFKINEEKLINSKDFNSEWYKLEKMALENVMNKEIDKMRKEFEDNIEYAKDKLKKHIGIYKTKEQ